MDSPLMSSLHRGLLVLTLNRPARNNALNAELAEALLQAFSEARRDDRVRAILIQGAGDHFCIGGEFDALSDKTRWAFDFSRKTADLRRLMEVSRMIQEIPLPVVTALKGRVTGPGLALALASDIRIADESTWLSTGYARFGLSGGYGGVYFLTRLLGSARARELLLLSPDLSVAESLNMGLVTRVVPSGAADKEAFDLAMSLADGPTTSFGCIKQNVSMAEQGSIGETLDMEAENHVLCTLTADHREANTAIREGRDPEFIGL